jgi:hypothetical protein
MVVRVDQQMSFGSQLGAIENLNDMTESRAVQYKIWLTLQENDLQGQDLLLTAWLCHIAFSIQPFRHSFIRSFNIN